MDEGLRTDDGTVIAGWILRSSNAAAVIADLKEFGQVFRFAIPTGPRADMLDAGQPCFLYVSEPGNPSVKPGIWAVGEMVGPPMVGDDDDELFAEVELLPLQQRIPLASLNDHRILGRTELLTEPSRDNPLVVRTDELRALEEWDFDLVEPTEEQSARLEEVLAEDEGGLIFQLVGVARSLGIVDDGIDGLLSVVSVADDGTAYELGRYEAFADAIEAVAAHGADLELEPAGSWEGDEPGGDPVAVLATDDGAIGLYRADHELVLWDDGEIARFADLADALAALAATVEEV
ncbi:MAG: hypothetical protein ABI239_00680 [Aquihabitans sp.]